MMQLTLIATIFIFATALEVVSCKHAFGGLFTFQNEDLEYDNLRVHFAFPDLNVFPNATPQVTCEFLRQRSEKSLVGGIVVRRVPLLTKRDLMLRYVYRNGRPHNCHLVRLVEENLPVAEYVGLPPVHATVKRACPKGWFNADSSCFFIFNRTATWEKANDICVVKGGKLATVSNTFQQLYLKNKLEENTWIGYRSGGKRTYKWIDNSTSNFTSWAKGEPNGNPNLRLLHNKDECVEMNKDYLFDWSDEKCDARRRVLCSVPVTRAFQETRSCHIGWEGFGRSCYLFSPDTMSWEDASDQCIILGAHLAKVDREDEHYFLAGFQIQNHWIGLSDIQSPDEFQWQNGEKPTFERWGRGHPIANRNISNVKEHKSCVQMNSMYRYNWTSEVCSTKSHFICESQTLMRPPPKRN